MRKIICETNVSVLHHRNYFKHTGIVQGELTLVTSNMMSIKNDCAAKNTANALFQSGGQFGTILAEC